MKDLILQVIKNKLSVIPISILLILSAWWIYIISFPTESTENSRQIWAALYQIMAIYGGIAGLIILKKIGGYKSFIGKTILFFSIGLLLQSFGQTVYSYYIFYQHTEIPYPSIGDIGFFGSIIAYVYAVVFLSKITGIKFSVVSIYTKLKAVLVPLVILFASYLFFLQGYEFDWSSKLRIFLDFGYPLGQALYLSLAIIVFLISLSLIGGAMKKPILFLIFALFFQYLSDFMFLYQAHQGTWYVGGLNDYLYFLSYFLMTMALIYMGNIFNKIRSDGLVTSSGILSSVISGITNIFTQISFRIIKAQEAVIGPIAWDEARKVPGVNIDQARSLIYFSDQTVNAKDAINNLVAQYERIFGKASHAVCRDAVQDIIAEIPPEEIPESLK